MKFASFGILLEDILGFTPQCPPAPERSASSIHTHLCAIMLLWMHISWVDVHMRPQPSLDSLKLCQDVVDYELPDLPEAPVYYPTMEEFTDPFKVSPCVSVAVGGHRFLSERSGTLAEHARRWGLSASPCADNDRPPMQPSSVSSMNGL